MSEESIPIFVISCFFLGIFMDILKRVLEAYNEINSN